MQPPKFAILTSRLLLSPDPHLSEPNPNTVNALALITTLAAAVSKARRREYANEPWVEIEASEHLDHATQHIANAIAGLGNRDRIALDDDGLPEIAHAVLRLAFAMARLNEKRERP